MRAFMNDIIENKSLKHRLYNDIVSDKFSHAYIIEGAKGSGKHTISKLIAAALSCERKSDTSSPLPCMSCTSCKKIAQGLCPDVITVGCEGKTTLSVDNIRFLREDVYIVPNELENKIYVIEDADKMTPQAQNAFLLTLEEPPSYAVFLLLCESADLLLETIRSRAPTLRTEPIPTDLIDEYICRTDRRAAQMKQVSPSDYAELLVSANHGIGAALELLDPKALKPRLEKRALVKKFVRLAVDTSVKENPTVLISGFSKKRDQLADELLLIYTALRDLMAIKKSDTAPLCFYESRDIALETSEMVSAAKLVKLIEVVETASDRISRNANTRLTLMSLLSEAELI